MNILVIGSGGREHALCWRLHKGGHRITCAPGNPGMADVAELAAVAIEDHAGIEALAQSSDLVVIGPEAPLCAGLADRLRAAGVAVFGPTADGAQLEGSKIFSKQFFRKHGIRTADFRIATTMAEVDAALADLGDQVVVKADGLAAGKGVVVCQSGDEATTAARAMLEDRQFGDAGARILIEQRLRGRELSVLALCDGKRFELLPTAEDHKAVFDGDRGPNTGGMGTVSPAGWVSPELLERCSREIFEPTVTGLSADGIDYRGVLYAGLMIGEDGSPWLLEYNCRFGDPETQPIMIRLDQDLAPWLLGCARGEMPEDHIEPSSEAAVCVVLAAHGYPASPRKGDVITGLDRLPDNVVAFHAGTRRQGEQWLTSGGRVLGVTARAANTDAARELAYGAIERIHFDGMHYRRDIGARRHDDQ